MLQFLPRAAAIDDLVSGETWNNERLLSEAGDRAAAALGYLEREQLLSNRPTSRPSARC